MGFQIINVPSWPIFKHKIMIGVYTRSSHGELDTNITEKLSIHGELTNILSLSMYNFTI